MKIRRGFVSNSSSSSFICELCGRTETGFDASPSDLGFVRCPNGHLICDTEALEFNSEDFEENDDADIPECACPICMFQDMSNSDFTRYFLQVYGIPRDEVFQEIKKINKRRRKLYDNEYVQYVVLKQNINVDEMLNSLKEKYITYSEFLKSLRNED